MSGEHLSKHDRVCVCGHLPVRHGPRCNAIGCRCAGFAAALGTLQQPAPVDRAKLIARITFVMPGLSDAALARLAEMADELRKSGARDLSSGTLAAEQRGREMAHG